MPRRTGLDRRFHVDGRLYWESYETPSSLASGFVALAAAWLPARRATKVDSLWR